MSKSKQKRKQAPTQQLANTPAAKKPKTAPPLPTGEPTLLHTVLSAEELELTVETLQTLAAHPSLIKTKAVAPLRTAVFDFKRASTTGALSAAAAADANLTARISGALADRRWVDARVLLAEMRIRAQTPKLGALCRWVRDLDVVSGLAEQQCAGTGAARTPAQREVLRVLDAVLRVVGPVDYSAVGKGGAAAVDDDDDDVAMVVRPVWHLRDDARPREQVYARVLDKTLPASIPATTTARFRILETTPGLARKPPNHHPAILHASQEHTIPLAHPGPPTSHHRHPTVPNLHLLKDVLTPAECAQIVGCAENIGFTPDAPIRGPGDEDASVLAHNFYWLVDTAFAGALWARVAPFVPSTLGGRRVRGLNRRFRVYRYVPGAEYRAHIDGAWPPSGVDAGGKYVYDVSSSVEGESEGEDGGATTRRRRTRQSSLFTFLLYLNDEFAGGETTYFLPGAREGVLNAYPLRPVQGSVALFPHGEVEGNLLHEGTGVRREAGVASAKYVIRTEVEYDVEATVDEPL